VSRTESGPSGSAAAAGATEGSTIDIGCGEQRGGRIGAGGGRRTGGGGARRTLRVRALVCCFGFVVHVRVLPLRCSTICFFKGNSLHIDTISFNTLFNT
jgi:hypothetical protein